MHLVGTGCCCFPSSIFWFNCWMDSCNSYLMFYVHGEPKGKFLCTEIIKLWCTTTLQLQSDVPECTVTQKTSNSQCKWDGQVKFNGGDVMQSVERHSLESGWENSNMKDFATKYYALHSRLAGCLNNDSSKESFLSTLTLARQGQKQDGTINYG